MKRIADSRRHPAVFGDEAIKGGNGGRVAQHNGNLPAALAGRGLALGAGLGLHSGTHQLAELGRNGDRPRHLIGGQLQRLRFGVPTVLARLAGGGLDCVSRHRFGACAEGLAGGVGVRLAASKAEGEGGDLSGGLLGDLHFISPKRANPADESSSHVTSDVSTPYAKEIMNGALA